MQALYNEMITNGEWEMDIAGAPWNSWETTSVYKLVAI